MKAEQSQTATEVQVCAPGCCIAGHIGSDEVTLKDWHVKRLQFEGKIELWNELTKRWAIPTIGFIQPHKFCIRCGQAVDHEQQSPAKMIGELVETLRSVSDSTAVLNHLPVELQQALCESLKLGDSWLAANRGGGDGG